MHFVYCEVGTKYPYYIMVLAKYIGGEQSFGHEGEIKRKVAVHVTSNTYFFICLVFTKITIRQKCHNWGGTACLISTSISKRILFCQISLTVRFLIP